jgi:alpha-beta hydrolase superfamily lysophospholipase
MERAERQKHPFASFLLGLGIVLILVIGSVATFFGVRHSVTTIESDARQSRLAPFYVAPAGWAKLSAGTLLRREQVGGVPAGGVGWRILYVTQRADGTAAVSSGLVFAPRANVPIPAGGRKVVAWAHPTVGMGDQCAPSRTPNVEADIPGLGEFLRAGWVVAATDYAGLGTRGVEEYLVGDAEAHDVLNSIRAARQIPQTAAGSAAAVFGHSQGGHAALFAADRRSYAPELDLQAVVAAAPAAELVPLIQRQWNSIYGSLIGAEVLVAYPDAYPDLNLKSVTARQADQVRSLAYRCIKAAAIDIVASKATGQGSLLSHDPLDTPAWAERLAANTPAPTDVPTLVVQGTEDPIVLPGTTARFVQRACAARSPVDATFIGALGHMKAGVAAAPLGFTWLQQRFAGVPATSTCGTALPVRPVGL